MRHEQATAETERRRGPIYINKVESGTIKFFNDRDGWGIIVDDDPEAKKKPAKERDLYFKRTAVHGDVALDAGTRVRFRRVINYDGRCRCWTVMASQEGDA